MKLADFEYELPPGAIAQEPLPEREASRLLVLERATGALRHHVFRDLPELLAPGDLVVVNRSRVIPARLRGRRPTGGAVEILLLRAVEGGAWEALVRPGRRLHPGDRVRIGDALEAEIDSEPLPPDARRRVRFAAAPEVLPALLARLGHVPLPPYIRRPDRPSDRERYQTVYAREEGSVAAPTAGLHFGLAVLEGLAARGIERAEIVLHVGPGTFQPVQAEDVSEHRVAPEPYVIPVETAQAIARARARAGRVVAVGTTVVRTLESAARAGGGVAPGAGQTALVIVPGFRFQVVDALVTNFHLPRSSLLLLVAAFAGRERVLDAYRHALGEGYRFYSYGDAMLVL